MERPSINIPYFPGTREANVGLDCLWVMRDEVIVTLRRVSPIILANPMTMTQMMERESSPPVNVLYCVSELYLSSSDEQNMSS